MPLRGTRRDELPITKVRQLFSLHEDGESRKGQTNIQA